MARKPKFNSPTVPTRMGGGKKKPSISQSGPAKPKMPGLMNTMAGAFGAGGTGGGGPVMPKPKPKSRKPKRGIF